MKIVLLILLCLVSSPTSHNGPNSILPLLIKAPVVVVHCRALFAAKKNEDNACWNTAQAFVCISLYVHLSPFFCLICKKTKTDGFNECFRVTGQVLGEIVEIF